jgi:hypothetical protein
MLHNSFAVATRVRFDVIKVSVPARCRLRARH